MNETPRWTLNTGVTHRNLGGVDHWQPDSRRGYAFPAEPSLLGEVLLRGIAEGA
jgi:hypothetical protein